MIWQDIDNPTIPVGRLQFPLYDYAKAGKGEEQQGGGDSWMKQVYLYVGGRQRMTVSFFPFHCRCLQIVTFLRIWSVLGRGEEGGFSEGGGILGACQRWSFPIWRLWRKEGCWERKGGQR